MVATSASVERIRPHQHAGIYTISDAALYLRTTTPAPVLPLHARSRRPRTLPSARQVYAWLRSEEQPELYEGRSTVIDFTVLIKLRIVAILRSRGLSLDAIWRAEDVARSLTGVSEPFVTEGMWTFGSDLFLKVSETLFAPTKGPQFAMDILEDFLTPVHHGLTFGTSHIATAWRPEQGVLMDPRIQFGAPCIEGTRIPTEVIWSLREAGDSEAVLAKAYGVELAQIEAAIAWEERLADAA